MIGASKAVCICNERPSFLDAGGDFGVGPANKLEQLGVALGERLRIFRQTDKDGGDTCKRTGRSVAIQNKVKASDGFAGKIMLRERRERTG